MKVSPGLISTKVAKAKAILLVLAIMALEFCAGAQALVPEKVAPVIVDKQDMQNPDRVHLTGWIGERVNGNEANRLPHVTNLSFTDVDGEQLLATLTRDLAVSSGSACTSASMEPSFVLKALGISNELAYSSVRFSLGATNDEEQIEFAIERVAEYVRKLRLQVIADNVESICYL